MRNFIVSDLHGNGPVYDSIMNYLANKQEYGNDQITLHINGGFNINYQAGNHELIMYQVCKKLKDNNKIRKRVIK